MCEGTATLESEVTRLRSMDIDDLRVLNKAVVKLVKEKQTSREMAIGANLYPGMEINFRDKRGVMCKGVIRKVNTKTCGVDLIEPVHRKGERWTVVNSLMEVID